MVWVSFVFHFVSRKRLLWTNSNFFAAQRENGLEMQMGSVLLMFTWWMTPVTGHSRQKGPSSLPRVSFPTLPLPYLISCPHEKKIGADFCDLDILNEFVFYSV